MNQTYLIGTNKTKRADQIKAGDYVSVTTADPSRVSPELDAARVVRVEPSDSSPPSSRKTIKIFTFDGKRARQAEYRPSTKLRLYRTYRQQG